jgi:TPR repeat protein
MDNQYIERGIYKVRKDGTKKFVAFKTRKEKLAVKGYRQAAEQGDPDAMTSLGSAYSDGEGVPKDDVEAMKWYHLAAAEQGQTVAMTALAIAYSQGRGLPQDDVVAAHWYRKAAEQGHAGAMKLLAIAYWDGKGVPQDEVEGNKWFDKSGF